ncbi:FKBP-type peptidyl-prolyl cis-trans isomerase FklB [hydrothermal vent metagenome]|uniref:peptidylprolyl isomerase n=1 Tax=hydrothermal vent metagenome TaxID=652676 RepID=A0A3B0Y0C5_9ZZZZ
MRLKKLILPLGLMLSCGLSSSVIAVNMSVTASITEVAGSSFRNKNKARKGVVTLDNGIQYEILKKGTGPKPKITDRVTVHYHGTLITGKIFDSSVKRGQPATFPVSGVIKGWQIIVPMMPIGSKWKVVIPPELAYGNRGAGALIGPGTTLVFEIELLSVTK